MSGRDEARARILARIREASAGREPQPHPGALPPELEPPWAQGPEADDTTPGSRAVLDAFTRRFRAAGGEVVLLADEDRALRWLARFCASFETATVSPDVPMVLRPGLRGAHPADADLGVSVARGAAAQTGSVLLSSREGRSLQVLPPNHLVWIDPCDVHGTLGEALVAQVSDLPAALALHSGPSKSADIGQIMVKGVHGPGRVVAAILGVEA